MKNMILFTAIFAMLRLESSPGASVVEARFLESMVTSRLPCASLTGPPSASTAKTRTTTGCRGARDGPRNNIATPKKHWKLPNWWVKYFFSGIKHCSSVLKCLHCQTKNTNFSFNFQSKSESIKLQNLVDLYKPAITTCKYGPDFGKDDIDCYSDDSTDLGGFGRKNQELPATNPRFGLTTTEDKKGEADASAINFGKR